MSISRPSSENIISISRLSPEHDQHQPALARALSSRASLASACLHDQHQPAPRPSTISISRPLSELSFNLPSPEHDQHPLALARVLSASSVLRLSIISPSSIIISLLLREHHQHQPVFIRVSSARTSSATAGPRPSVIIPSITGFSLPSPEHD